MDVLVSIKTDIISQISVTMKKILEWPVSGISLLHPMVKMPVMGLEGQ